MHSPDKTISSSSSSSESEPLDTVESSLTFPDQQVYNEVPVEETDSWPGNFRNNVRCLVKKDKNQTLKGRLGQFFLNEDIADVHFMVKDDDRRVPAHKFILSAGSCVFKAMFYGSLSTPGHNEIKISDIDYQALYNLLKYLYVDEADINPSNLASTLYAAKKYQVTNLEKICINFLGWSLTSQNVLLVLSQAILFDEAQLIEMCLSIIDKDIMEVLEAPSFENTDHATLLKLIEQNVAVKEIDLFKAVMRWAVAECARQSIPSTPENHRLVLGKAIELIRFPLMCPREFATGVVSTKVLTHEECVELFVHFTVNPKPPVKFSSIPRSSRRKEYVARRFGRTDVRWGYSGTSDQIKFVVDKKIFIKGFGLYGSIHGPSEYECIIMLIDTTTGKEIASNATGYACDGSAKACRVMFKKPVEIYPDTGYTACATLKGSDSHYGASGRKTVVVALDGGRTVMFKFFYSSGCNNGTSVEDGQIPEIIFHT